MSNGFDEREKGYETKFSRDQEADFKVNARRNKLLGLWIADKLGLTGDEANDYALSVVKADFEEVGHEDVIRKVMADLQQNGLDVSEHTVRTEMDKLIGVARAQIESEA